MTIRASEATGGEAERISTLGSYDILDTPPEQGFEDIVHLAAQICATPVALVSLVEIHRQWFKAHLGFEPCETPIDQSVCAHALGQSDLLVIPDLTLDPRTKNNLLVTGPSHIRFYAGAPLVASNGHVLGTLCVIDDVPRPEGLTSAQRTALEALARQVMTQLELRRAVVERDAALSRQAAENDRHRQVVNSATEFAIIVTDRNGTVTEWNCGAERVFGWAAEEIVGGSAETIFTPEDRRNGQVVKEMMAALTQGRGVDERWHLKKDGTRFWASGEMMPLRDDAGEHVGFVKIARDRTEQHLAGLRLRNLEVQLRQAQEAGGVGLFAVEVASGIMIATPEMSQLFGLDHAERRPAQEFEQLVTPDDQALVSNNSTRRAGGSPKDVAYRIRRADTGEERWIARKGEFQLDQNGTPVRFVGVARDITGHKSVELQLAESERKWRGLFENLQEGFILGCVIRNVTGRVVDWRYEEVNTAWYELTGVEPGTALGRTIRDLWPGIEDAWVDEFADVVETGRPVHFTRQVGVLDRWFDGVAQPAGPDRFTVIFLDVTERVLAERRREALRELGDSLLVVDEADAMLRIAAEVVGRALGVKRVCYGAVAADGETVDVSSDWTAEGYASLAGTYRMSDYGPSADELRRGRTVVIPDIRTDPRTSADPASLERLSVRALVNHPVVENGRTVALFYVDDDEPRNWTEAEVAFLKDAASRTRTAIERRHAEDLLRESAERQRLALAIGEVGTFDLDLSTGALILDERARAAFGVHDGRVVEQAAKLGAVYPEDRPAFDAALKAAMAGGTFDLQFRTVGIDDAAVRWVAFQGRVIDGSRFIGAARDVSERVAAEERRTLLNNELSHRLKNAFAVVQSIVSQTLRNTTDPAAASKVLSQRIQTLSRAHDILLAGSRDAGSMEAVVRSAVALHDADERMRLHGPDLTIGPKAALSLALTMHELATNAGKYGALSVPEGYVEVAWTVEREGTNRHPTLTLDWIERGGPPVTAPTRRGFGTRLIEMGLSGSAGGSVDLDYDAAGLRCRIVAPLTELQVDESSPPEI